MNLNKTNFLFFFLFVLLIGFLSKTKPQSLYHEHLNNYFPDFNSFSLKKDFITLLEFHSKEECQRLAYFLQQPFFLAEKESIMEKKTICYVELVKNLADNESAFVGSLGIMYSSKYGLTLHILGSCEFDGQPYKTSIGGPFKLSYNQKKLLFDIFRDKARISKGLSQEMKTQLKKNVLDYECRIPQEGLESFLLKPFNF